MPSSSSSSSPPLSLHPSTPLFSPLFPLPLFFIIPFPTLSFFAQSRGIVCGNFDAPDFFLFVCAGGAVGGMLLVVVVLSVLSWEYLCAV